MKKKLMLIAMLLVFAFSVTACGSSFTASGSDTAQDQARQAGNNQAAADEETMCSLNSHTVLQEDGLTITAETIGYEKGILSIVFQIKNETDCAKMIQVSDSTTVNGYQIVGNGYSTVEAGATGRIYYIARNEVLELISVHSISDIQSIRPNFTVRTDENGVLKNETQYIGNEVPVYPEASVAEITGAPVYSDENIQLYYLDFIPEFEKNYSAARFLAVNNCSDEEIEVGFLQPTINGCACPYSAYIGIGSEITGSGKAFQYIAFEHAALEQAGISKIESVELKLILFRRQLLRNGLNSLIEDIEVAFQIEL